MAPHFPSNIHHPWSLCYPVHSTVRGSSWLTWWLETCRLNPLNDVIRHPIHFKMAPLSSLPFALHGMILSTTSTVMVLPLTQFFFGQIALNIFKPWNWALKASHHPDHPGILVGNTTLNPYPIPSDAVYFNFTSCHVVPPSFFMRCTSSSCFFLASACRFSPWAAMASPGPSLPQGENERTCDMSQNMLKLIMEINNTSGIRYGLTLPSVKSIMLRLRLPRVWLKMGFTAAVVSILSPAFLE